jgi:hypothetical protein
MKRRDFLKYGAAGVAGVTFGGVTRYPIFKIGKAFAQSSSSPWSFGVMGDTQWTPTNASGAYVDPAGTNPNSVAASIIEQVNPQFINLGVQFVIQVGDLSDEGLDASFATRATAAQELYNAGIGFFPLRGNHDYYGGEYGPLNSYGIPAFQANFPQTQGLTVFNGGPSVPQAPWGAYNFSSSNPTDPVTGNPTIELNGVSYSFDYGASGNNVRFMLLDCWPTVDSNPQSASLPEGTQNADGYAYGYTVNQQQAWVNQQLNIATRGTQHAFVFAHQPLMAEDHQDTIFSGYTNANPSWQNALFSSLMNNGVGYYISGHDHMHQRSIIQSPDGNSQVEELICQSCSSKFYTPASLTSSGWYGQKGRETSISQELYTVGFYIFTVNGPILTVDYYSDTTGNYYSTNSYPNGGTGTLITPTFNFARKETWGYNNSNNGSVTTYNLTQGGSTALTFGSTTAKISKTSTTAQDYNGRDLTKDIAAWWAPESTVSITGVTAISDCLTLLGAAAAATVGSEYGSTTYNPNDAVAIQISYDPSVTLSRTDVSNGRMISIYAMEGASGNWQKAVSLNYSSTGTPATRFVYGPWNKAYPVGYYGVDTTNNIAWAVVNHDSDFVVVKNF